MAIKDRTSSIGFVKEFICKKLNKRFGQNFTKRNCMMIDENQFEFDSDDDCACSLTSTYEIWENDSGDSSYPGADLTLSVDDWISGVAEDSETKCAQVTALNQTGTAVGSTVEEYANCGACNDGESLCTEGGGGPGGP